MRPGTKKRRPSLGERKIVRCALSRNTAPKYVHVYQKSGLSTRETTVIEKALKQTKRVVASVVSIACSKRSQSVTMQ